MLAALVVWAVVLLKAIDAFSPAGTDEQRLVQFGLGDRRADGQRRSADHRLQLLLLLRRSLGRVAVRAGARRPPRDGLRVDAAQRARDAGDVGAARRVGLCRIVPARLGHRGARLSGRGVPAPRRPADAVRAEPDLRLADHRPGVRVAGDQARVRPRDRGAAATGGARALAGWGLFTILFGLLAIWSSVASIPMLARPVRHRGRARVGAVEVRRGRIGAQANGSVVARAGDRK